MYEDFLPPTLVRELNRRTTEVPEADGLRVTSALLRDFPDVESSEALQLVGVVFRRVQRHLEQVLTQRVRDREFVDRRLHEDPTQSVIGLRDNEGRVVIGPSQEPMSSRRVPPCDFMAGAQVTLFGPPDSAKMSINAMNAIHRKLSGESPLVAQLVEESGEVPRW